MANPNIPQTWHGAPLRHEWPYLDRDGSTVLGIVARYEKPPAKKEVIPFFQPDGNGWKSGHAAESGWPLYGLHSLARDSDLFIVEGEKCAAALHSLGFRAVTSPGGCKAAAKADWTPLDGCQRVIILPDNDDPGKAYCDEVAGILAELPNPPELYRVDLPDLPHKGDVVDWMMARVQGWDGYTPVPRQPGDGLDEEFLEAVTENSVLIPLRHCDTSDTIDAPLPLLPDVEVQPFPVEAMGTVLGGAAMAIHRTVQAPLPMCCNSVLAVVALATQAHADVKVRGMGRRPISGFFLTVGESGERKSAVDRWALSPVRDFETELRKLTSSEATRYKHEKTVYEAAVKKVKLDHKKDAAAMLEALNKLGPEPTPPASPVRIVSDLTIEGLQQQLDRGHPALGLFTDEGGTVTGGHGMLPEQLLHTLTGLSELWDGKPMTRVRKQDGTSTLAGKRLSLHLMFQPEVAASLLDGIANGQGFLPRCLTVWPVSTVGTRFYVDDDPTSCQYWRAYADRIRELMEQECEYSNPGELDPNPLPKTYDALDVWRRFHDDCENRQGRHGDLLPVKGLASKMAEHALRLAGVLAVFEDGDVNADRMQRGCELATYYLNEAMRIRGYARDTGKRAAADRLLRWMQANGAAVFAVRDIQNGGPNEFRPDAVYVRELLTLLDDAGWIERLQGKPERYRLRVMAAG